MTPAKPKKQKPPEMGTALEEIARAIHDAQWEEPFDELRPDGIERAMAMKQAAAVTRVIMGWFGLRIN